MNQEKLAQRIGIDGVAVKPSRMDPALVVDAQFDIVTIDFEGREHVPPREALSGLDTAGSVLVTVPLRADGFDPLGDRGVLDRIPAGLGLVFVAGHPDYLAAHERARAIEPRLTKAVADHPDAWIGTEGIEELALATGRTQFDLLSPGTERRVRRLRETGFTGTIAVYAPTVLTADTDEILDAVGSYVARRGPIRNALTRHAEPNRHADGQDRSTLLRGAREFTLTGDTREVAGRVRRLRAAGVDVVISYPARGYDVFSAVASASGH